MFERLIVMESTMIVMEMCVRSCIVYPDVWTVVTPIVVVISFSFVLEPTVIFMMIYSSAMTTLWKPVSVSVVAVSIGPVVVISAISFFTVLALVLALLTSLSATLFIVIRWTATISTISMVSTISTSATTGSTTISIIRNAVFKFRSEEHT